MASAETFRIEVVAAMPDRQELCVVRLPAGGDVAAAVALAGIKDRFPEITWAESEFALWGRPVEADYELHDGDRVEVLRPLERDPRDARRELAREGQFMGSPKIDED